MGQSEIYYDQIKNILNDKDRVEYYTAMRDVAYDLELYNQIKDENVTNKSLMRSVSYFMIHQQFHRIAMGKSKLTPYDIEYTFPSQNTDNPAKLTFHVEPESFLQPIFM